MVPENTAAGENVGDPVTAMDADNDTLAYTLSGAAVSFDIDPDTGQLMTRAALDYEAMASYEVTVTATDPDRTSDMITVTITVTNVDEMGRVTFWRDGADATTAAIMVGDKLGGAVDDSDGNPGDTFPIAMYTRITAANITSWQWAKSMTPDMMDSWMEIGTGGMYTVMDDDAGHYLRATAMYDDGEGMGKMASMKTMMVTMNASPMFDSETAERMVPENTAAGENVGDPVTAMDADNDTLIYTLGGTDAASFDIGSATGQLMTRAALDYEAMASYEVTVTATDPDRTSDMITVTITVTNVDEMGRVTFWRDGADATTAAIMVGDKLGGAVDDSDGNPGDTFPIAMYTRITAANITSWQWAKSMTPDMMDSWMEIGTGGMYTVMDDDAGHYLRATAMYDDGEGMGKMASMKTMMVTMNASPMFDSETAERMVPENTAAGENVGDPVTAMDADNDTLIYTLGGTDAASFDIGSATGQLMTRAALDYEAMASYEVTVTATDPDRTSDMITVTITVTDVDEDVVPADPLVDKYDANENGEIERTEVFAAINDYLDEGADAPTRADVFKLIELYLGD